MPDDGTILSVAQTRAADEAAIASGLPGIQLMEEAGAAVTRAIRDQFSPRRTLVVCGPGNNGGDGFVVARLLQAAGWQIDLALLGNRTALKGDAAAAASRWHGAVLPVTADLAASAEMVVDALFGAGLSRPVDGVARALIEAITARNVPVVAVDVPSGVDGNTGAILGVAPRAALTVTFCRHKPGHVLLPGRSMAGRLVIADIGISDDILGNLGSALHVNAPQRWLSLLPRRAGSSHKYSHGHAVILGGPSHMTGAARLAARAALRVGAGLVTIACPQDATAIYASQLTTIMVVTVRNDEDFAQAISDKRRNAVLLGPGAGVGAATRRRVRAALRADKKCVLDADALTSFEERPKSLFGAIRSPCVLTPHEGEFARLFDIKGDKLSRARAAAVSSGACIVLKGGDTVIAAPDGRAAIEISAPASLATAGSGDVLAGLVVGLLAQEMPAFEAACAAVWCHAQAARRVGIGLIAEDLSEALPPVLRQLHYSSTDKDVTEQP